MASAEATLNVRLPRELKERGDAVLAREGTSVSKAVRGLYQYVSEAQTVPSWLRDDEADDVHERRRRGMRRLVGVASVPEGFTVDDLRDERLSRFEC